MSAGRLEGRNITRSCEEIIMRKYFCKTRQPDKDEAFYADLKQGAGRSRSMYANFGHFTSKGKWVSYNRKPSKGSSEEEDTLSNSEDSLDYSDLREDRGDGYRKHDNVDTSSSSSEDGIGAFGPFFG